MIRDDYIMRLIEQITAAMAKILLGKEFQHVEEVEENLQSASMNWVGLDYKTLRRMPNDSILDILSPGGTLNAAKCYAVVQLFLTEARLHERRGRSAEAPSLYARSLDLMLTSYERLEARLKNEMDRSIEQAVSSLTQYGLPVELTRKLVVYYERVGQYARAEDCLFELVDAGDKSARSIGEALYGSLAEKRDSELRRGNLSRAEVAEGIRELRLKTEGLTEAAADPGDRG
jgi:hypothetical protein